MDSTQSVMWELQHATNVQRPYKCPSSCAATIIPEKPPVSSTMATLLTFSSLLLTTQAPPT